MVDEYIKVTELTSNTTISPTDLFPIVQNISTVPEMRNVSVQTLQNLFCGWIPDTATWTYASATTFTVTGDARARFKKGTKVKFVQSGTTKYGVVAIDSTYTSSTLVTLITNTDYTIANAAITGTNYTYEEPSDFPAYLNYTTTVTASSGSITSTTINSARFKVCGRNQISVYIDVTITNNGTGAGAIICTLPVTSVTGINGCGREDGVTGQMIMAHQVSGASNVFVYRTDGSYPGGTNTRPNFTVQYIF